MDSPPASASYVVVACDATRERTEHEIKLVVDHVQERHVFLPSVGYQTLTCPESFAGTNFRAREDEVKKKVDAYATKLLPSYEDFESEGVKVTAGFPIKQRLQNIMHLGHLRRDLRYHLNKMPCKIALVKYDLSLDIWRSHYVHETKITETKCVYSLPKFVSLADCHSVEDIEDSIISCKSYPHSIFSSDSSSTIRSYTKQSSYGNRSRENSSLSDFGSSSKQDRSGISIKGECRLITSQIDQKQNQSGFLPKHSDAPLLCTGCGTRLSIKESMRFSYSDIQSATNDFSKDKLLGEGGYGHVYNGVLKDGQQIAAKVRKEESSHGPENNEAVLEWHQRYAIAIGTAKELRFLHEECRGGPIIHRDMRPSNRLLTHDFVPMLGDFGLAKWKTDGIVSVGTDVYSYGIILLISGRQVGNSKNPEQQQSLRLWAEPMIEKLALHELIDTRLGESYDTYELYLMAKDAYFCVQRKPEMRPSMGEVYSLLDLLLLLHFYLAKI
ncbi:putative receptor-like serine/threonine-protein kinase [Glycine soja]